MSPALNSINTKFYRKSSQGLPRSVDLDDESARILDLLDETTQLSTVAEQAGVSLAVLWKAIAKLSRLGLIEDASDHAALMGQAFVDALESEFARAVGPISQILIKKTVDQMRISLPDIPVDRSRELVKLLAGQIPDEHVREAFQRSLLKDI
jgi:hypothetical protein